MSIVMSFLVVALFVALIYAGARDGAFFTMYALVRNGLAFLCAVTFFRPLGATLSAMFSRTPPAPEYFVAIAFVLIFGAAVGAGRWLKVRYTFPDVKCFHAVDRSAGAGLGLLNAIVLTGTILIMWSLMPFARYIPADLGRAHLKVRTLDTGPAMLEFYAFASRRMPGGVVFLLHDETIHEDANGNGRADPGDAFTDVNQNGRWDRGWLWRYRTHADILPRHLEHVVGEGAAGPSPRR